MEERTAIVSYPRSGNSLLRSIIERLTGIYTGSDGDPRRPLNQTLIRGGFLGEGMVDNHVFVVKSHFPERLGWTKFSVRRAILCVRNPFDVLISYFNMLITSTHTDSIEDEEYVKFHDLWESFVRDEMEIWKQFHAHWLSKTVTDNIDLLLVRYEDLVYNKRETYKRIATFIHRIDSIGNSEYVDRLVTELEDEHEHIDVYFPRHAATINSLSSHLQKKTEEPDIVSLTTDKKKLYDPSYKCKYDGVYECLPLPKSALKSMKLFSDSQIKYVLSSAKSELSMFGYWNSFFASYGEAHVSPRIGSCLLTKTNNKRKNTTEKKGTVTCNTRYPLRPISKKDPFGRGFSELESLMSRLPPVKIIKKTPKDSNE